MYSAQNIGNRKDSVTCMIDRAKEIIQSEQWGKNRLKKSSRASGNITQDLTSMSLDF